jgi:solute carrier family 45, member 1/2/4
MVAAALPSSAPRGASFTGSPTIRGSSPTARLLLLTLSLIGIQFTWGVEMTYCTPYLLSLGLTKSKTSLVWVAGPLSGLIMQPVVGALSDKSTSKWGRRRPFMVVGSVIVGACLVLLGWTQEIVEAVLGEGAGWEDDGWKRRVTVVVAVFSIYAIDFAINAVMSASRSIIIDTLPLNQQQDGSAWAARMGAAGSVVGYFIGSLDLVALLPGWLGGSTQFKKMIVVALAGLWSCVGITSWAVGERVLVGSSEGDLDGGSVWSVLPALWKRTVHLPPRIKGIVWAQFWGWIGWFPFLFYSSTWVGETYFRYDHPEPVAGETENDLLGKIGQLGSVALVIFSIVTFASSVLLPYLVSSPEQTEIKEKFTARPPGSLPQPLKDVLHKLSTMQPDLVTGWMISNLILACILFWAPFVRSLHSATLIVALCGIPWAMSCFAPFAEIGVEINKMGSGHALVRGTGYAPLRASIDEAELDELDAAESQRARRLVSDGVLRLNHPTDEEDVSSTGELSGVYLGVLNVYTTLPQFVGTFISWIVFSLLESAPPSGGAEKSEGNNGSLLNAANGEGPNAISVCLFIGSISAVVAAEATRRLRRMSR